MLSKILVLLSLLLLVAACTISPQDAPREIEEFTTTSAPIRVVKEIPREVQPVPASPVFSDDPALAALLLKNKDATNLHYVFDVDKAEGYEIFMRGGKVKKVYTDTRFLRDDIYYNKIFMGLSPPQAIGICDKLGITCSSLWNKAYQIPYEREQIYATPAEIVARVRNAREAGSEFFDGRQLKIIEFVNGEGRKERLSVDQYYGLPLRQVIYAEDNAVQEQHTFTNLEVGQMKENDVDIPIQYALVR